MPMLKLATKFAPVPAAFETAHSAGFRCAELWLDAAVLERWEPVAALARHYPIEYALHFPNRLDAAGAEAERVLSQAVGLYRALGCRAMCIHQPMFDRHAEALMRLAPEMRLAVENHRLNADTLRRWAEGNPGLTLDVEHFWKFTHPDADYPGILGKVREFLAGFAGKLRHVHLPGYRPGGPEHRPQYYGRDLVFPVLSLLSEFGFDGLIVSEADIAYQTLNDLRMDVLMFETWRRAGDPVGRT
jgi:hypothetical protein